MCALYPRLDQPHSTQGLSQPLRGHWHPPIRAAAIEAVRKLGTEEVEGVVLDLLPSPHARPGLALAPDMHAIDAALHVLEAHHAGPSPRVRALLLQRLADFHALHAAGTRRSVGGADAYVNASSPLGCHAQCLPGCVGSGFVHDAMTAQCREQCHVACHSMDVYEAQVLDVLHAHARALAPHELASVHRATRQLEQRRTSLKTMVDFTVGTDKSSEKLYGNKDIGVTEKRKFAVKATLKLGLFGGTLGFGATARATATLKAFGFSFTALDAKASFIVSGSLKFEAAALTEGAAAVASVLDGAAGVLDGALDTIKGTMDDVLDSLPALPTLPTGRRLGR